MFRASAVVVFSSDVPVDFLGRKYMASVLCPGENAHRISPSSLSSVYFPPGLLSPNTGTVISSLKRMVGYVLAFDALHPVW